MKPRDWYLLFAGPALLGLAAMGCTDATASKPPAASRAKTAAASSQAPGDTEATSGDSTELAEVDPNTIVLSVPGMH